MPVYVAAISFSSLCQRAHAFFGEFFKLSAPTSLFFSCFFIPTMLSSVAHAYAVNQRVSVFSTYPSEALLQSCYSQQKPTHSPPIDTDSSNLCFEDAISPDSFINVLSESGEFNNLLPYGEGSDYELLIANVGAAPHEHQQYATQFAEFTLQWRGIEIDSSLFDSGVETRDGDNKENTDIGKETKRLISRWLQHVRQTGLFTSKFLFDALEASNYDVALQVPDTVGEFKKLDTQLFPDPFSGAITRYTHPDYEDALVDVTVYPFIGQLSTTENELLPKQLESDLQRARATAERQKLTLSQISPASPYAVNSQLVGWKLGLSAASDNLPTIYATTYVFRQQDKIVKVSTTFPPDFSDNIVNKLIVEIQVPQESVMMKKVRDMLLDTQR